MGSKGSQTTTNQTTSAPDPNAYQAYLSLLNRAQGVAATPYQAYTGQLVAPVNQQQYGGIGGINAYANSAQPYIQAASSGVASNMQPITGANISQYLSPYTQNVVNATQAQFNNQNQQQLQNVRGNAIAQGALGGNREAIAEAETTNQQQLAQAPTIANLYNQGYNTALNTALQEQGVGLQGANMLGQLGLQGQAAGLQGAQAQIGAGTLEQNTQQAINQALLQQYQQQQAFPYQQTQWLAGLETGVGSQMGGTSSGQTTGPAPNSTSQWLGLGTAGLGALGESGAFGSAGWLAPLMFAKRGGRVPTRAHGGGVAGYDSGGSIALPSNLYPWISHGVASVPFASAPSYIPMANIAHGSGAPRGTAPGVSGQSQGQDLQKQMAAIGNLGDTLKNSMNGNYGDYLAPGSAVPGAFSSTSVGGPAGPMPLVSMYNRGGVAGYADGGDPTFDDRWNADQEDLATNPVVVRGINNTNRLTNPDNVVNPDQPFRMPDAGAVDQWRKGVDRDLNLGQTAQDNTRTVADIPEDNLTDNLPESNGIAPASMAYEKRAKAELPSNLPPEIMSGGSDGVVSAPSAAPSRSGIDWSSSGKLWPALMSAGFGMMASRSPFLGVAVGEGGEAGLATYGAEQQREAEAQRLAQQMELQQRQEARQEQAQRISAMNQPLIVGPGGQPIVNQNYITARQQLERDWQPKLQKIGVNDRGDDVMGVYDPNTKRATDLQGHPVTIDSRGVVQPYNPNSPASPSTPTPPLGIPQSALPSSPNNATAVNVTQTPTQVASIDPNFVPGPAASVMRQAGYQTLAQAVPHTADATAAPGTEASRDTQFLSGIARTDPGYALALQKAADYQLDPGKYASLRKNYRQRFIDDVLRYDPNYNPQNVGLIYRAQTAFLPGTKTGDTIGSFNTAISHLDVLKELYHNLNNPDVRILAKIRNDWNTYWRGQAMPNTVAGIAQMVSGEVVKATVGAQNALGDREEAARTVNRDLSTMQATDVIDKYERLMGGKLETARFQYEKSTGLKNFDDKFLLPRSQQVLKQVMAEGQGGQQGKTLTPVDKQALDWANAHSSDPRAAAIKKKLGVQ